MCEYHLHANSDLPFCQPLPQPFLVNQSPNCTKDKWITFEWWRTKMNVHIWCPVQRSGSRLCDLLAKLYQSLWADLLYDDEACNEIRVLLFSFMERQERVSFWSVMLSLNAFIFSYPDLISRRCIGYGNKRSIPHVLCGLTKTRTYRKSHRGVCMPSCGCLNIPAVAHLCSFPGSWMWCYSLR